MVGGGVRGKADGIAHRIIDQVGHTITVFHLFMKEYRQDGERTTVSIVGMGMNFIINDYLIRNFNRFGKGRSANNLSRNIERDHSMPGRRGIRQIDHALKEEHYNERGVDHSKLDRNSNTDRDRNNLDLRMEDLKGEGNLGDTKNR